MLPLFHTGGLNCYSNPVLHAGGTVVIMKTFDPGEALRLIGDPDQGITHFFAVPAPYQFMMQHPDFADTDLSRLRVAGVGGAPCALTIMEAWTERGVDLAQGFGMTETSPACIFLDPGDALRKIGSTGKALMHTEFRIVDDDGGDCGPDEIGELWVAGPNITPGYWNKPEATAERVRGSLAEDRRRGPHGRRGLRLHRRSVEGHVHLRRRERVPGRGRERALPAARRRRGRGDRRPTRSVGRGRPRRARGRSPAPTLDRATVVEYCVERLAKFKIPNDIAIVDALPRNATGKVLKRELRARFVDADSPAIS